MDSESGDSKRKSVYYYEWVELDKPLCNKGHMMLECVCGSIQCANEFRMEQKIRNHVLSTTSSTKEEREYLDRTRSRVR